MSLQLGLISSEHLIILNVEDLKSMTSLIISIHPILINYCIKRNAGLVTLYLHWEAISFYRNMELSLSMTVADNSL